MSVSVVDQKKAGQCPKDQHYNTAGLGRHLKSHFCIRFGRYHSSARDFHDGRLTRYWRDWTSLWKYELVRFM